jgi:hypothetical protein
MAHCGEWSRLNNQGQTFLREDSFSPGYTLFSVGGMVQDQKSKEIILHCLRRIGKIAHC